MANELHTYLRWAGDVAVHARKNLSVKVLPKFTLVSYKYFLEKKPEIPNKNPWQIKMTGALAIDCVPALPGRGGGGGGKNKWKCGLGINPCQRKKCRR
jgi:hypothetical protein